LDLRGLRVESFQCQNHPEREGVGICVACRRVFCVECSTKIDGVNHCRECLGKRQKTAEATRTRGSGLLLRAFEVVFATSVVAASLLLVFGVFSAWGANERGARRRVDNRERMDAVARALRAYKSDTGAFPTDDEGLGALVNKPQGATVWHGPYLERSLADSEGAVLDAMGEPVHYRAPRSSKETACVIGSSGGDRVFQTDVATVERPKVSPNGEGAGEGDDLILFVE
jgi:type II secretory pathway pseudopilin PulG